ncbi:MAG: hypothetical protein L3J36_00465 [Rhodobacteraceae bacterium]|nr:hypothetical protein [Paracoccaceae bacterium]
MAGLVATPALAEDSFVCTFARECPTNGACISYEPQTTKFTHDDDDIWSLAGADGRAKSFSEMQVPTTKLRAFVSATADPDAPAVSLLTIFDDGSAILGIHGIFLSPGSVTHLGTCVSKDG